MTTRNSYPHDREFTRIPIDLIAEIETEDGFYRCDKPRDLAMRGIYLYTDQVLPMSTQCRVTLRVGDLESGLAISVQGRVVRCEESGMAIQFTGLSPEAYNHLRNLVLYNADDSHRVEEEMVTHLGIGERK